MIDASSIMSWVLSIEAKLRLPPHELLGVASDASELDVQDAFHGLARVTHPDRYRHMLTEPQLDRLTRAYARVADAYAQMSGRSRRAVAPTTTAAGPGNTTAHRVATPPRGVPTAVAGAAAGAGASRSPSASTPSTDSGASPLAEAAKSMNSKALVYFRRAENALSRGNLRDALMQLKLAVASDPKSQMLRRAITEVEVELKKA